MPHGRIDALFLKKIGGVDLDENQTRVVRKMSRREFNSVGHTIKDLENFFKWFEAQDITHLFVAGDIGDNTIFDNLIELYCRNKKVFVASDEDDTNMPQLPVHFKSRNVISLSNPSMVEINGIKILIKHRFDIKMLKKRHLGKIKPAFIEDPMTLEELPDIVHCGHTHEGSVTNYKSTTIVNSGSLLTNFRPVVIDFSTRDCQQLNVSELG